MRWSSNSDICSGWDYANIIKSFPKISNLSWFSIPFAIFICSTFLLLILLIHLISPIIQPILPIDEIATSSIAPTAHLHLSNPSIHFISTAFMKSLFRFFTNFGRIYYFWIRDMKSGWPPSPFVKKSIKVVDRISLISLKSNPPNSTRSYWWLIWSIIKISFWSPDHLVDLRVFELFPEVSHDVPQLHSGNYPAIYNSKETSPKKSDFSLFQEKWWRYF